MYSYFHSLGNWNLVWLFGSTGVDESVADILHFVPLMAGKHQTSGWHWNCTEGDTHFTLPSDPEL